MLILSRKEGEKIMISKNICVTILKNIDGKVDVGISAPKSVSVHRWEIYNKINNNNNKLRNENKDKFDIFRSPIKWSKAFVNKFFP